MHLQLGTAVVEGQTDAAAAPRWIVTSLRSHETLTHRCGVVVGWTEVLSCVKHGAGAVPATSDLHRLVMLRNQMGIEPEINSETVNSRNLYLNDQTMKCSTEIGTERSELIL